MSNLRLIGLIVGLAGLVTTFLVYRGARWNRANFLFFSFLNIFLITVTINPASINFLRDMLALEDQQRALAAIQVSSALPVVRLT